MVFVRICRAFVPMIAVYGTLTVAAPTGAQPPMAHGDMFYSTSKPTRVAIPGDTRFQNMPIPLSLKNDPTLGGQVLILQGDMIIARGNGLKNLVNGEIGRVQATAKSLLPQLADQLDQPRLDLLNRIISLKPDPTGPAGTHVDNSKVDQAEVIFERLNELTKTLGVGQMQPGVAKAFQNFITNRGILPRPQEAVFLGDPKFRWTGGIVPFYIDGSIPDDLRAVI